MSLKIEHRTGVLAPAEVIWEILADVAGWPTWTQIYPQAAGKIGYGETLILTLALPGEAPRVITPTVLDWTPDEAVHWRSSAMGGLVSSVRYLEIERLHETGCVFSNGEIFGGPLGTRMSKARRRAHRLGFTALGDSLRDLAEAAWRQRVQGAT